MKDVPIPAVPGWQAWNAFAAGFGAPMRIGQMTLVLSERPAAPAGEVFRITVTDPETGRAHPAWVALTGFPFAAVSGVELDLAALDALSEGFRSDILASALAHLGGALPAPGLDGPPVPAGEDPGGLRWLDARIDGGWGAEAACAIGTDEAAWTLMAERLLSHGLIGGAAGGVAEAVAARIPMPLRFVLARLRMKASAAADLEPGDMLVPPPADTGLWAEGQGLRIALDPAGEHCTIREIAVSENEVDPTGAGEAAPPEAPQAPEADGAVDVMEVPVTLTIVAGQVEMTLADLAGLAAGATLPLPPPAARPGMPVTIHANGKRVGEGNLVEIDGAPAIRIARIFGKG